MGVFFGSWGRLESLEGRDISLGGGVSVLLVSLLRDICGCLGGEDKELRFRNALECFGSRQLRVLSPLRNTDQSYSSLKGLRVAVDRRCRTSLVPASCICDNCHLVRGICMQ
jgi:hypothetical protein